MPILYRCDVLAALKEQGITTYRLRKDKIMGERTIQQLRDSQLVSWETMTKLCELLSCQPGDLVYYAAEPNHLIIDGKESERDE